MTQPRALEPVLGGGRLLGLRARGSRGACPGLSNSPVAGFTLCCPTTLSWFTASPAAEVLVSPLDSLPRSPGFGSRSSVFWSSGMDPGTAQLPPCMPARARQGRGTQSSPGPCGHPRGPWSLTVTRGLVVSLVLPGSRGLGGGGDIGGASGGLGGCSAKKSVLPLLDWPVLGPGRPQGLEELMGQDGGAPGRHQCVFIKDCRLVAKHTDPTVHHLTNAKRPAQRAS